MKMMDKIGLTVYVNIQAGNIDGSSSRSRRRRRRRRRAAPAAESVHRRPVHATDDDAPAPNGSRSMAFTPSAPTVLPVPVPPPSSVALVTSVVVRRRALVSSAVARWRAPVPATAALRALQGGNNVRHRGAALVVASAALDDVQPAIDADLRAYLESQIITSDQMSPAAKLTDVMSRPVQVATPGQRLAEVDAFFAAQQYSGLPVVDEEGRCIGVISHKDKDKAPNGLESTVGEVMSSPPIMLTLYKTVLEAAALMIKEKVHRIPVVNEQRHVIGIVTRSDVFQ